MKRKDRRYYILSEEEDRAFVAHLGEDARRIAGKGQLSMRGDKRDSVLNTIVPLASNYIQYEQGFATHVEASA